MRGLPRTFLTRRCDGDYQLHARGNRIRPVHPAIKTRLAIWKEVAWRPATWLVNGLFAVYGFLVAIRDAFPNDVQAKYPLNVLLALDLENMAPRFRRDESASYS